MIERFFINPVVIFYTLLAVSLILVRFPIIGLYFRTLNTLYHEMGHAFLTLAFRGKVYKITLNSDTSGSATTSVKSSFGKLFVALSGYTFAVLCGAVFFYLVKQSYSNYVIYITMGMASINLLFYVKNSFGVFWTISFIVLSILVLNFDINMLNYGFAILISSIIFSDSLISGLQLVYISVKNPNASGDAKLLSNVTKIPALIWAILILAFIVYIEFFTVVNYFPKF